jgi:hypothetical protein
VTDSDRFAPIATRSHRFVGNRLATASRSRAVRGVGERLSSSWTTPENPAWTLPIAATLPRRCHARTLEMHGATANEEGQTRRGTPIACPPSLPPSTFGVFSDPSASRERASNRKRDAPRVLGPTSAWWRLGPVRLRRSCGLQGGSAALAAGLKKGLALATNAPARRTERASKGRNDAKFA